MSTSDWKRLEAVIRYTQLSVNAFALGIGLKRAEVIYRVKRGKNAISKDLAELITIKYCNISKSWLLTGEGSMYIMEPQEKSSENEAIHKKIPVYQEMYFNLENILESKNIEPSFFIEIPHLLNCDFATPFCGDSMLPEIPSGSLLILKKINLNMVLPGEMYYIVTNVYSTVKYIRTIENEPDYLTLIPSNTKNYDIMKIDKAEILSLFLVKGIIAIKVV